MLGVSSNVRSKWKRESAVTLALTVLMSSQAILIVRSKRAGKYEYNVEALKYALSFEALARIWRNKGVTKDNRLSEIQWAAFILLCAGCTTAQLNTNGIAVSMVMKYADNIVKGQPYDINADMAAGKLAAALCAEKLILEYWRTVMIPRAC